MNGDGRLLSGQGLLDALNQPDRIFRAGSWSSDQVLGAGYSVRLGGDLLVIPSTPGNARYTAVTDGARVSEFTLAPGDSALISTIERFTFDFDVTATIGDKFGLSARGLLILHGSTVHPGYGRQYDQDTSRWSAKSNERLYFVVANVGPTEIHLREGDQIAYLQFFAIEPAAEPKSVSNVGFDYLSKLFRADHDSEDGGLAYFRNVKDLRSETETIAGDLRAGMERLQREFEAELSGMRREVAEAQTSVDRVTNGSNTVVVFGVFLVGVTLLGFVLTSIADLVEKLPEHLSTGRYTLVVALAVAYALAAVTGVVFVAQAARATVRGAATNRKGKEPGTPPG
ncbi:hypothetical protein ACEZCY_22690 [Streptacidiphilus sp. N1-12]|uniref:Uncharacterized protein n=2 Tax=Streptacidiphilus alkalitolerans TaxID=3342712 RepID=A0ABV6WJT6_9ACTN